MRGWAISPAVAAGGVHAATRGIPLPGLDVQRLAALRAERQALPRSGVRFQNGLHDAPTVGAVGYRAGSDDAVSGHVMSLS